MMIDQTSAREKAEQFLDRQDLKQHSYKFSDVKSTQRRPNDWGIVFDVYSPENTLVDGPIVVIVDKVTGNVRFL